VIDRALNGAGLVGPPTDPAAFLTSTADPTRAADLVRTAANPTDSSGNGTEGLNEEAVAAQMGLALLAGLVDDLEVATISDGVGTEVCMSWPLPTRSH
jgi:hypothetical protein